MINKELRLDQITPRDIQFIKDQTEYVNNFRKQLITAGEVNLKFYDIDKLDKISQTLNSFRLLLETTNHIDEGVGTLA